MKSSQELEVEEEYVLDNDLQEVVKLSFILPNGHMLFCLLSREVNVSGGLA